MAHGTPVRHRLIDDSAGGSFFHHARSQSCMNLALAALDPEVVLETMTTRYHLHKSNVFVEAQAALDYACELYKQSCDTIRGAMKSFSQGASVSRDHMEKATYPFIGTRVDIRDMEKCRGKYAAYGVVKEPGYYGTTVTRPDVMYDYYNDQLSILMERYEVPLVVGLSTVPIPLPFVTNHEPHDISSRRNYEVHEHFVFPDLTSIHDDLPNCTASSNMPDGLKPLSMFNAPRIDLSLQRLAHYCGTSPKYFQGFILLTNYQRYIDEFIVWSKKQVLDAQTGYTKLIGPHDTVLADSDTHNVHPVDKAADSLPQMPAYHLVRSDGLGITFVNIGVGPSNAKTITDHLAVLRPHCWLMLGHCAGLRVSQNLGDYVLAHAYVREDHVLDQDLPPWVPLPPIAEVQRALVQAATDVLSAADVDIKMALRTGTVVTTDNRDWELRAEELKERFKQSRAIAVDMESATVAANGFRFRVPYGTLLCVSDKPIHGELKLQGMANEFYRQRVAEHLHIGLETIRELQDMGVNNLHSRKLRGFDEPPFR